MVDTRQTRRRLLQTAGVAIGGSIVMGTASADHEETWRFHAELTTEAETHDVEAPSSGHATFEIPPDDHRIHYTVDVEWLCDGTQAHIHLGDEGEDGPVVAWLYPEEGQEPDPIEGRFDGTLAEGTLTVEDLVGPLEGASEEEIVMALVEEDAYVNVHTEEYPDGEIRGQIRPDGDTEAAIAEAMEADEDVEEEVEPEEEGEDGYDEEEDEPEDDHDEGEDDDYDGEEAEDSGEEEEEDDPGEGEPEEDPDESTEESEEPARTASDAAGMLAVAERNVDAGRETDDEWIQFENTGSDPLDMAGWTVTDRDEGGTGSVYEFGEFVLEPDAQVRLVTGGERDDDTGDTVHWELGAPRWNRDGDIIVVLDANGDEVLAHEYGNPTSSIRGIFDSVRALFA